MHLPFFRALQNMVIRTAAEERAVFISGNEDDIEPEVGTWEAG
jgi:hypothetical protein